MTENKNLQRDFISLVLFLVGTFGSVSVVMKLQSGVAEDPSPTTAALANLARTMGDFPLLSLFGGLGLLGVLAFAMPKPFPVGRSILGVVGLSIGLSLLLGSILGAPGGRFGLLPSSQLGGSLGDILGGVLGAAVLAGSVWIAWFPEFGLQKKKPGKSESIAAVLRKEDWDGVSPAEAEALLPDEEEIRRLQTGLRFPKPSEDVRRRGGIPEGAIPLTSDEKAESERAHQAASSERRAPEVDPGHPQSAAADLASSSTPAPTQGAGVLPFERPEPDSAGTTAQPQALAPAPTRPPAQGGPPPTSGTTGSKGRVFPAGVKPLETRPVEEVVYRPSWERAEEEEQPSEVEDSAEVEPAVEVSSPAEMATDEEPEDVLAEVEEYEEEDEDEYEEDEEDEEPEEVLAEVEEDEEEYEEEEEPEEVQAEAEELEEEDEEEYEEEEEPEEVQAEAGELEEEDEEELEEAEEPDEVLAEVEELEEEDEEELEEEEEPEEVLAENEQEDELEGVPETEAVRAESGKPEVETEEELEEEEAPAAAEAAAAAAAASEQTEPAPAATGPSYEQSSLFDLDAAAGDSVEAPAESAPAERTEADYELTPQASSEEPAPGKPDPPASPVREEPAVDEVAVDEELEYRQLVHRAGCLILERKRVAVSMLQRNFDLDFKRATEILDDLQNEGLIGPYIGGTSRDILMTLEDWTAKAPAAS